MTTEHTIAEVLDRRWPGLVHELPTVPEAAASLLRTIVVAIFVLTFIMDPCMIPSASMEPTLRIGDFLLSNRQVFAPENPLANLILPYRDVRRGDIVVFYHSNPPLLVKRVVALPGDRLRIAEGHVYIDGLAVNEPYARYGSSELQAETDDFPPRSYDDPEVDPNWWQQVKGLDHNGELTVPANEYFVLGDNRNHSEDSRYWGFVPRQAIFAKPLVIYFSVKRPLRPNGPTRPGDKLEKKNLPDRFTGFARWNRIFCVVH
ncbi:MAG TPA: signal peptidase I [Terracidiphilus sp.]